MDAPQSRAGCFGRSPNKTLKPTRDGSVVGIGSSDLKHLMYANHIGITGKVTALIPLFSLRSAAGEGR